MANKRVTNTILNSSFASISQFIILIFAFITRTFFIRILGAEYLGFDALFSNILSVLSIVDLGIGTALNFSLYKPMHEQDKEKVAAIIQYFKKLFYGLGALLLLLSLLITPFIGYLVKDIGNNLIYMQKVFFLYAIMTFSTYFFVDCRTLYFSSQQNYKVLVYDFIAKILVKILQVVLLINYPSYLIYLGIEIITNLIINLLMKKKAMKEFSYVYERKYQLLAKDKKVIFNDVKYLSLGKIASVGIASTDSLIISKYIGTASLGAYSNYWLITGAAAGLIGSFTNGIVASLGDLFAENDKEKISFTFNLYNFITFQASAFYLVAILSLIQPFMYLWLKGDLLLDRYIIGIVVFNNAFGIMWNSIKNVIQTKGLFRKDLPIQLTQVALNLIFSLILVQRLGMVGVFLGTTISQIIAYIMQVHLVSNEVIKSNLFSLLFQQMKYGIIAIIQLFLIYTLIDTLFVEYTIINLIFRGLLVVLLFGLTEFVIYRKNNNFKACLNTALGIIKKFRELQVNK